jgi:quinol monooxygenase YgiN
MSDVIHVVAKLQAKPGKEGELKGLIEPLIAPTRKEKGCLRYDVFQGRQDPTVITLIEAWDSNENLDTHLALPHLQKIFARLPELLAAPPDIVRYKQLG